MIDAGRDEEQALRHRDVWNASVSPKKFIPKKPARNDIGRNITVTIVNVFMMSFVRFEIADR